MTFLPDVKMLTNYRRAVHLSMLYNPTGKAGKFQAIDWLVEHNNLYLKVSRCLSQAQAVLENP